LIPRVLNRREPPVAFRKFRLVTSIKPPPLLKVLKVKRLIVEEYNFQNSLTVIRAVI